MEKSRKLRADTVIFLQTHEGDVSAKVEGKSTPEIERIKTVECRKNCAHKPSLIAREAWQIINLTRKSL